MNCAVNGGTLSTLLLTTQSRVEGDKHTNTSGEGNATFTCLTRR